MKKILFIEDEAIAIKRLIEKLKKRYEVEVVGSGNSALDSLNENQYDLILLDIMLPHGEGRRIPSNIPPKQTGIEILKKIRNRETKNSPQIPIVVLTAVSDVQDLKGINKYRPTRLFQKPREFNVLYESITEAIESQ